MKEKIYMIPVNDAYKSDWACPLCYLKKELEKNTLDYYLGPSLMEPDVRVKTNQIGFCGDHLSKLYHAEINRLGMGLMLHTHVQDFSTPLLEELEKAIPPTAGFLKNKNKDYIQQLQKLADFIEQRSNSCIVCEKINDTMERYLEVIMWMFFHDPSFVELFRGQKNHCLLHLSFLLRGAAKHLSQNQAQEFLQILWVVEKNGLDKMVDDLEWFTLKFDYRNQDKPWKDSKDAIPRAICLLSGQKDL